MQKNRLAVLGVALAVLSTTAALCQTDPPPTGTTTATGMSTGQTMTGRVTNVDTSARTFSVDSPQGTMTFGTSSTTHIMTGTTGSAPSGTGTVGSASTGATLSSLKVGDQVRVTYSAMGSTRSATHVEVVSGTASGSAYGTGTTTGSTYGTTGTTGTATGSTYGTASAGSATGTTTTGSTYGTTGTTGSSGSATGRVVSVDRANNTMVVETSTGRDTFRTTTTSRFMSNDRNIRLDELKPGDQVVLSLSGTGMDRTVASVDVTPQGSYSARTGGSSYGSTGSTDTTDDDDRLPSTASPVPLAGLLGMLALMAAAGLRIVRRRA